MAELDGKLRNYYQDLGMHRDRRTRWEKTRVQRKKLHDYLQDKFWLEFNDLKLQEITGLDFGITRKSQDIVRFEVHAMWPVQRQRQDGSVLNQVVFSILQHKRLGNGSARKIWGGCTIIVDLGRDNDAAKAIRYVVRKPLYYSKFEGSRIERAQQWAKNPAMLSLAATYGMADSDEPFAMLHSEE
jgi:hypothetical protein